MDHGSRDDRAMSTEHAYASLEGNEIAAGDDMVSRAYPIMEDWTMEHVRNLAGLRNPSKRTHVASHVLGSGDLGWKIAEAHHVWRRRRDRLRARGSPRLESRATLKHRLLSAFCRFFALLSVCRRRLSSQTSTSLLLFFSVHHVFALPHSRSLTILDFPSHIFVHLCCHLSTTRLLASD